MLATELATSVCGYDGCDGVVCGSSSSINQEFHHSLNKDSVNFSDLKCLVLIKTLL